MKSFIIKKPNQTTPQFGNLWLGSPGREDQRGWLQTHTPLIYSFFRPGPNYSLHVKSEGSESLHKGRASMSTEKGLNDAVTLLWYQLVTAAWPRGFLVKQCTLVHKQGWRISVLPVPPPSQESRHGQHRQLDDSSGRPTLTFMLTPDNYPRGKILPQMQTYPSSVHGQKSIRVFSPHLVQLRFLSKAIVFVQLRAEFSLCFGMQTDSKLKTHKRTWRD